MDGNCPVFLYNLFQCLSVLKRKQYTLTSSQKFYFFFLQFKPYCFSPSHHASWSTAWLHPARPLLYLSLFINVLPVLRGTKLGPGILDVVLTACSAKDR